MGFVLHLKATRAPPGPLLEDLSQVLGSLARHKNVTVIPAVPTGGGHLKGAVAWSEVGWEPTAVAAGARLALPSADLDLPPQPQPHLTLRESKMPQFYTLGFKSAPQHLLPPLSHLKAAQKISLRPLSVA